MFVGKIVRDIGMTPEECVSALQGPHENTEQFDIKHLTVKYDISSGVRGASAHWLRVRGKGRWLSIDRT